MVVTSNIFLVLLLATSCCTLCTCKATQPDDGMLEEVVDTLTNGTTIQKLIIRKIKESVAKIDELMKDMERRLSEISADIGVINSEKIELTRQLFATYRNTKSTLRLARNKLRELADKTVRTTDDLILYMQAWEEGTSESDKKEYLAEQVKLLDLLLKESEQTLGDAKKKYNQATTDIDTINNKLEVFQIRIQKMVTENTAEHDSWVLGMRAGVYGTSAGVTVGMAIADVFGCLGFCSGIVTSTTWTAGIAAVETKIAQVKTKLRELDAAAQNNVAGATAIAQRTKEIQTFIQEETKILIKWDNVAKHLKNKLENVNNEKFSRLHLRRESFTRTLVELRDVAQEFWDTPDGIFGEEVLEKKIGDPVERRKNLEAIKENQKMKQETGFKLTS